MNLGIIGLCYLGSMILIIIVFLRRGISTLIRLYRKNVLTKTKFVYFLETLEHDWGLQVFPLWHGNELFDENPFGGSEPIIFSERHFLIPSEFTYLPYTFFFLLRFYTMNFYRFRKIPAKGNCKWGLTYSFLRVPSSLWTLNHQPGLLRVVWALPIRFLFRWTAAESELYEDSDKYLDRRTRWFKSQRGIWRAVWSPEADADTHEQFLRRLKLLSITKNSNKGAKRFFVEFFLSIKHPNYEYFALDLPILFRMRTWIGFNYLRKIVYFTKEGDILRFYVYSIYNRIQFDTDHVDRMLNFVSWLEFLKWKGTLFPWPDYLRTLGKSFDVMQDNLNFSLGLPVFSKLRKIFWFKK